MNFLFQLSKIDWTLYLKTWKNYIVVYINDWIHSDVLFLFVHQM